MNNIANISELCKNKEYDKIYEIYGRKIYLKYTPKEYQIANIKKLLDNKLFNEIYNKYGKLRKVYVKDFDKYKKLDIKNLLKEGNFEQIRIKYGEKEYNKHLKFMFKKDVSEEIGNKKRKLYRLKKKIAIVSTIPIAIYSAVTIEPIVTLAGINVYNRNIESENLNIYADMVTDYEKYINDYAENIRNLNLTDLQVIMMVMNDIWQTSELGNPKYDIYGFWGYDIYKKGPALCRNLAADFAKKMNAIDNNYKATNIVVDIDTEYEQKVVLSNVERKISSARYYNCAPEKKEEYYIDRKDRLDPELGNHIVTLVTLSDGCTLCVDVTNPSIGIIKYDKIDMLSSEGEMDYKNMGTLYIMPLDFSLRYNYEMLKRLFDTHTIEYYENKYGVDAQNEALEYVKQINEKFNK